ncbi:MAG: hypothetical protein A3F70_17750 [Acidobacteria bacterium RIFCSPLOWO2_12_FULL_67_14]|nr:MAG: hypothetical protein A3F70_17750 [Acidobacteria bacterium RIFCSPLOWO2_12_FULL_67_14]
MELAAPPAAGDALDSGINGRAVAAARQVEQRRLAGVRDVVSTFRSVAVFVDPLRADVRAVTSVLGEAAGAEAVEAAGRVVDVPVVYGGDAGPDLAEVAAFAGCAGQEVVERHSSRTYRVFMLGFLPGFAYLGTVDPTIAVPRKSMPRVRVPAGSVGIAGRQTGIYPRESPGGWQIIGRTSMTLFDAAATPPALLAPGDEVRFVPVSERSSYVVSGFSRTEVRLKADTAFERAGRSLTVLKPGLLTTIQDAGRWGYQNMGVPVAGPMDGVAHRLANLIAGNTPDAAGLEATLVGPELRFEQETWIAIAGADLQPSLDGAEVPRYQAVRCRTGTVLRFGARRSGARAYVALGGGIATPPALGSRATDVRSGLGGLDGRALRAGDRIALGTPHGEPRPLTSALRRDPAAVPSNGARLRILPGPQIDCFDAAVLERLQEARYTLTPQSDRMGYRLTGGAPLPAPPTGEMISDAAFIGGLQVPPSGDPILLMVDRQTTGGYPQIGVVIAADIPLAAQLRPGDWIEFQPCSHRDAIDALAAQSEAVVDLR